MNPTDTELADARECLARLAEFAGGDDYLSAGSVRQNLEAVQAAFVCPVPAAPDEPSAIVDRMMRRLSAPDLPAVGQHADLIRSLRGHDGPAVARTDGQPPADDMPEVRWDGIQLYLRTSDGWEVQFPQNGRWHYQGDADAVPADSVRLAAAAPTDMPAIVASAERSYVEALNAILAAPGGSDDVDRWRGQAEAYRTVAEQLRRDHGMPRVEYGSGEWRRTHGVPPVAGSQPEATDG